MADHQSNGYADDHEISHDPLVAFRLGQQETLTRQLNQRTEEQDRTLIRMDGRLSNVETSVRSMDSKLDTLVSASQVSDSWKRAALKLLPWILAGLGLGGGANEIIHSMDEQQEQQSK